MAILITRNTPLSALSLALFFSSFYLPNVLAASPCSRVCSPGEIEEVSVLIASADMDTLSFRSSSQAFHKVAPGTKDLGMKLVSNTLFELPAYLQALANSCKRIKRLDISSHGSQGSADLDDDSVFRLDLVSLRVAYTGLDCAMAPQAEIHFDGCNVGRGCRGEDFLMGLAQILLPKGGSIEAPMNYAVAGRLVPLAPISLSGTQALTIGAGLKNPAWSHPPLPLGQCRSRISELIDKLAIVRNQLDGCTSPNVTPSYLSLRPRAEKGQLAVDDAQSALNSLSAKYKEMETATVDRTAYGLTSAGLQIGVDLIAAFNLYKVAFAYNHVGPCVSCAGNCHLQYESSCFQHPSDLLEPMPRELLNDWLNGTQK